MNSSGRRIVSFMLAGLALLPVLFTVSCRNREDISHKDDYQQAYVYAYPMIAYYKTMYQYFIDKSDPQYKAPFNTVANDSQVVTPKDTAVVAPDADTLSSMMQVDLRAEPIVFCVPDIERSRFYDVQLTDMYTYNYGYVGTRLTGNDAGCYMVAGPGWKGVSPEGIRKVFQSETQFSLLIYRTQLFGPKDIDAVKKIQAGYTAQPMSQYAHQPAPPPAPAIDFPKYTDDALKTDFPRYLNFLLQFCPQVAEEVAIRLQFATIGIGPATPFDPARLTAAQKKDLSDAVRDGITQIDDRVSNLGAGINGWHVATPFGNRDSYHGDFLRRAAAAKWRIFGNDGDEALSVTTKTDGIGAPLDGSKHNYALTFPANQYPPVNAFWSLTLYDGKTQLLIDNPINRYLINSPMLPSLKRNPDGSFTIYIQKDDPGGDKKANWLPAPAGSIYLVMRLYWPRKPSATSTSIFPIGEGTWKPPGILTAQ